MPENKHSQETSDRASNRGKEKQSEISDSGTPLYGISLINSEKNEGEKIYRRQITQRKCCTGHKRILLFKVNLPTNFREAIQIHKIHRMDFPPRQQHYEEIRCNTYFRNGKYAPVHLKHQG